MWIFCSGMMRSGSTLQYQIAKTLIEGAGLGIGVGSCAPGRFHELLRRYDDLEQMYVVKSHRYLPTAHARLHSGEARSIYIYRDLRDVVVSMMHKESRTFRQLMEADLVQDLLQDDAIWSARPRTLVSAYETVTADVRAEVQRIAAFLGVNATAAELDRIASDHSLASQNRRIQQFDFGQDGVAEGRANLLDPNTLLHHNHVRSGASEQWAEELTAEQVAEIEEIAGDWLVQRGYALAAADGRPVRRVARLRRRASASKARLAADLGFRLAPPITALKRTLFQPFRWISDLVTSVGFAVSMLRPVYWLTRRKPQPGRKPGSGVGGLQDVRRVLVVRVDEIGDVVLTTPFLRELRANLPEAEITLVVKPGVRNLVESCPHVDRVLTYDWAVSGLFGRLKRHARALRLARRLWPLRLDLALLPRWARDRYHGAFVTYFSGAARRIGYSETVTPGKRRMNAGEDRLFTRTLDTTGPRHEVERSLDLLRDLGGEVREDHLELWVDDADQAFADQLLAASHMESSGPLVAVGIGAGSQRRVWPLPRFAEVAGALQDRHGARLVVLGGQEDRVLGESFGRHMDGGALNLIGRTTLRQAAAVLRRCDLYVGNDTGVMHLAAAVEVPVVEISCHPETGSAEHDHSPARFGPWGVESRVLRPVRPVPPCTDGCGGRVAHCITGISVDRVLEAADQLLRAAPHARHAATNPLP